MNLYEPSHILCIYHWLELADRIFIAIYQIQFGLSVLLLENSTRMERSICLYLGIHLVALIERQNVNQHQFWWNYRMIEVKHIHSITTSFKLANIYSLKHQIVHKIFAWNQSDEPKSSECRFYMSWVHSLSSSHLEYPPKWTNNTWTIWQITKNNT